MKQKKEDAFPTQQGSGLSKREYFAAVALQYTLKRSDGFSDFYRETKSNIDDAIWIADQLIEKLNEVKPK
jgi:hypothetical protein